MKNLSNSKIMPCKTIVLENQSFKIGERLTLDITDMNGRRSAHKPTAAPVIEIKLWETGDIREIRTELGCYQGPNHVNDFNHGNMPMAVVHYYNEAGSGILKKEAYHTAKSLIFDLQKWYAEHGNRDIMVYIDIDDQLTFQRVVNICLTAAGVRPCVCSLRHAAATQDFDLM